MDYNDYKKELEKRLLCYMDQVSRLKPANYKDIQRFNDKSRILLELIKTTREELIRVENAIKQEKADKYDKPRIK
jgi:prephenate dehydrogenase